ncbi:DNA excision repair protein ERCC-8-like [Amblyomma americanum]
MFDHRVECGFVSRTAFKASERLRRLQSIQLSRHQDLEPFHGSGVNCLSLDPVEGRYLLSGGADGGLCIHDLHSDFGKVKRMCKAICKLTKSEAHIFSVSSVHWYPCDTGLFTSSGMDGKLRIWDTNALRQADSVSIGELIFCHHVEAAQPNLLAVGSPKPWVVLSDIRTGSACQQLRGHLGSVLTVRWNPHTPGLLASGSRDGAVKLWDVRCARGALATLQGHKGGATALTFLPDGMQLLSMGHDGQAKLWDVARRTMSRAHNGLACCQAPTQMSATQEVALLPSGHCLLVMDLTKKQPLRALSGAHFGQANCVLICSESLEAFSGANDRTILWWTSCGDRERALDDHQDGMPDSWSDEDEPL